MVTATEKALTPFRRYCALLLELHSLLSERKGESAAAEEIREEMDVPWGEMDKQQQSRARGLSHDLHLLAENNPKPASMTVREKEAWVTEFKSSLASEDTDQLLTLLRQPYPEEFPAAAIPYLRARCYEIMGAPEAALRFMQEAERMDPNQARWVLLYLKQLDRKEEAREYVSRVLQASSNVADLWRAADLQLLK